MKMKKKDYKNISDKEKGEIKFVYEYEKSRTKTLEKVI